MEAITSEPSPCAACLTRVARSKAGRKGLRGPDAADCVQAFLARMWRDDRWAMPNTHGCAACAPFVRAAAKRHVAGFLRDLLRRWSREVLLPDPSDDEASREGISSQATPEEACVRDALREAVRRAMDELPVRQQELLRRHYLGGEAASEISADLRTTVAAVEQALHRARLSLRRRLAIAGWVD